jgi:hypothetical protein
MSKGKEVMQIPKTTVLTKPIAPLTRSSARKKSSYVQGQLAAIEKPHTSPAEGEKTVKWLNKQLREAQDLIIQLREENRLSELRIQRHFQECGPTITNACATLSKAQSKLKRSALLSRQVQNLKRHNLSLRKTNRSLRLQVKIDEEGKGKMDLLAEIT